MVDRGLAADPSEARALIAAGRVVVDGVPARSEAAQVDAARQVGLRPVDEEWVSRGALKLLGALDAFGIDVSGAVCADLGASTGGFTEVLLRRGAARVYAIDVGRGLLHRRLEVDPRVVVLDGVNARAIQVGGTAAPGGAALPEPIDRVVGDLSFIGLDRVLGSVRAILGPSGEAILLVKPQFEVGRGALGAGGVVDDPHVRQAAIDRVRATAEAGGFTVIAGVDSVLPGARSGNVEHFLHLRPRRA